MTTWIESESPTAAWVRALREQLQERERAKAASRGARAVRLDSGSKAMARNSTDQRLTLMRVRGSEYPEDRPTHWAKSPGHRPVHVQRAGGAPVPAGPGNGTPSSGGSSTGTGSSAATRTPQQQARGAWKLNGRLVRVAGR